MSYADGRDFSPEYTRYLSDGTIVEIEKLGGGTVGEAYEGTWRYRINADGYITLGQDLHTGTPKTHAEAMSILVDFLYAAEDETPEILGVLVGLDDDDSCPRCGDPWCSIGDRSHDNS